MTTGELVLVIMAGFGFVLIVITLICAWYFRDRAVGGPSRWEG